MVIKPTIGRVLWFFPTDEYAGYRLDNKQPFDAHVCYVHNDRLINIVYFDHVGQCYPAQSAILVQEGDPKPEGQGWCEWMPYQVGQAKKHEEPKEPLIGNPDTMPRQDFPLAEKE